MDKYDSTLRTVVQCVRISKSGVVGAAVVDGDRCVVSPSKELDGKFLHAERNALESFRDKYGEISSDAVVVTTLSPCKHDDEHRVGESCTDMLLDAGITEVYTGYIDPWQLSMEEYASCGMNVTETDDAVLFGACEALFEYFPLTMHAGEEVSIDSFVQSVIPESV